MHTDRFYNRIVLLLLSGLLCLTAGCGKETTASVNTTTAPAATDTASADPPADDSVPLRDNTPAVLTPEASGTEVNGSEVVSIDSSNQSKGYIMVSYTGTNQKVKLIIKDPGGNDYYYNLHNGDYETFNFTGGNGSYQITVYENISGDQYAQVFTETLDISLEDELLPYLYPNQYVYFTADTKAVAKGSELAASATTDLDVVAAVYDYITENITYDHDKAETVESGYVPDVDETLATQKGICFDYASLMASMLRTQGIPTRLEIGYAGTAYHAWISTHIDDIGWVNGIIEFDGETWKIMDPTFAASQGQESVAEYIGDGSNYQTKYIY